MEYLIMVICLVLVLETHGLVRLSHEPVREPQGPLWCRVYLRCIKPKRAAVPVGNAACAAGVLAMLVPEERETLLLQTAPDPPKPYRGKGSG